MYVCRERRSCSSSMYVPDGDHVSTYLPTYDRSIADVEPEAGHDG